MTTIAKAKQPRIAPTCASINRILDTIYMQKFQIIARRGEAERSGQAEVVEALTNALTHLEATLEALDNASSLAFTPLE